MAHAHQLHPLVAARVVTCDLRLWHPFIALASCDFLHMCAPYCKGTSIVSRPHAWPSVLYVLCTLEFLSSEDRKVILALEKRGGELHRGQNSAEDSNLFQRLFEVNSTLLRPYYFLPFIFPPPYSRSRCYSSESLRFPAGLRLLTPHQLFFFSVLCASCTLDPVLTSGAFVFRYEDLMALLTVSPLHIH